MDKSKGGKPPISDKEGDVQKGASPSSVKEIEVEAETVEEPQQKQSLAVRDDKQKQELQRAFSSSPVDNLTTPEQIHKFAESLIGTGMCPYKKPGEAVIAIIAGKELGLSLAATFGGIYPIEGRPSLGVHIKKGILLQNNVLFKKIHDYEPYYEFVDFKDKSTAPVVLGYGYLEDLPKYQELAKHECKKKHIDTRTEYLFTRYFKTYKGVIKNTAIGMFSLAEAQQAKLTEKHNWKSYTRDMMASRAFSRGANEIADDLLHGMYSYSELADLNDGVTYYIDENGHEQIVK